MDPGGGDRGIDSLRGLVAGEQAGKVEGSSLRVPGLARMDFDLEEKAVGGRPGEGVCERLSLAGLGRSRMETGRKVIVLT